MHASYYVVRTQPHAACLSTVESVALALSKLECQPQLEKTLIKPLVAMCGYQVCMRYMLVYLFPIYTYITLLIIYIYASVFLYIQYTDMKL